MYQKRNFNSLNKQSDSFERLNGIVQKSGEKGLKLILLFKMIKKEVLNCLKSEYHEIDWIEFEDNLNEECMNISKEILSKNKETPTEEDINEVIKNIKKSVDSQNFNHFRDNY